MPLPEVPPSRLGAAPPALGVDVALTLKLSGNAKSLRIWSRIASPCCFLTIRRWAETNHHKNNDENNKYQESRSGRGSVRVHRCELAGGPSTFAYPSLCRRKVQRLRQGRRAQHPHKPDVNTQWQRTAAQRSGTHQHGRATEDQLWLRGDVGRRRRTRALAPKPAAGGRGTIEQAAVEMVCYVLLRGRACTESRRAASLFSCAPRFLVPTGLPLPPGRRERE
eukprot:SAG11_NODE_11402_length_763_cov_0.855422_1_plen_221_part_10